MADGPISFSDLFDALGPGAQELLDFTKSVTALNRSYGALASRLDKDSERISTGLQRITTGTTQLRTQISSLDSASEQERAALSALSTQVATLAREQQRYQQAQAGQATVSRQTRQAVDGVNTALREQQGLLRQAFADKDIKAAERAAAAIRQYKSDADLLNKALRGANTELTAAAGSYDRLAAETAQLGVEIRALPGGFEATNEAAQRLKKQFFDNTQRLKDFDRELNQNFREVGSYAKGILEAVAALERQKKALTADAAALRAQAGAAGLSAEQQDKLQAELRQTDAELGRVNGQLRTYGVGTQQGSRDTLGLKKNVGEYATSLVSAYLSLQALSRAVGDTFEKNVEYSDQLADVRKRTGLAADESERLVEQLKRLETRSTLASLIDEAKIAGEVGEAKADILDFVQGVDVSVQALQDDFAGGAEEISRSLGKINRSFKDNLGPSTKENLINIGSAINELSSKGNTAPYLTNIATGVAATANNAKLGLAPVLAYASVLEKVGFEADPAATSLDRLFNTLSTRTKAAFDIAKLGGGVKDIREFRRLINTDFEQAINVFLRGLKAGGTTTTKFNQLLGTLKLTSGDAKSVITTLANSLGGIAEAQRVANEQLASGTSVAEEAALKTNNLAGAWAQLKKNISSTVTNGGVTSFFKGLVDFAAGGIFYTEKLNRTIADQAQETGRAGAAMRQTSAQASELLTEYQQLAGQSSRSATEQQRLAVITLRLKDLLGESVLVLNKQTGAYELNAGAVQQVITKNQELSRGQATGLARQLANLNKQKDAEELVNEALSRSTDLRAKLLVQAGVDPTPALMQNLRGYLSYVERMKAAGKVPKPSGRPDGQVEALKALDEETQKLGDSGTKLEKLDRDRYALVTALRDLGYSAADAQKLLTTATKEQTKATRDDIEADKEKKKTTADLAKAKYELAKQRLEAQATNYERQAGNPANSEAIRAAATQKATQTRIELARLERDELIREAQQTYKDQIGGEQAAGVARVRLTEAFNAKRFELTQASDKQLLALHAQLLDQLAQVDKLVLEAELEGLDQVVNDENRSYDERQKAAYDAAARRIKLIQIESDTKRRAAKGDLQVLQQIDAEEKKLTAAALAAAKPFDSAKYTQELEKGYALDALTLESLHSKKLISEKNYLRQVRALEYQQEADTIAALEREYGETAEVLRRKVALRKRLNEDSLEDERATAQARAEIIRESFQALATFGDAFFQIGADQRAADLEDIQHNKEAELQNAGDNAELKAQIEESYRARELEARRKQAKFDKAQALFNVALNTAAAVTSVLSTGGGTRYADFGVSAAILSGLVIAQGLAQAVAIAAKPLPSYFKGRDGGPAEWANVAEHGPELIREKAGAVRLVQQPSVTYLQKGDAVETAARTTQLLRTHQLVDGYLLPRRQREDADRQATLLQRTAPGQSTPGAVEARQAREAYRQHEQLNRELIKAWHERPEQRLSEDGLRSWQKRGAAWTEYTNKRYKRG